MGLLDRSILNRRPSITFVSPRSGITIPDPISIKAPETPKAQRIKELTKTLDNIGVLAEAVEAAVAQRSKNEVLTLDLSNPEDAVVSQALARQFPDKIVLKNGIPTVPEITFDMFNKCLQKMKAAGKAAGRKQQMIAPEDFKIDKTNFGGTGKDRRPDINKSTLPFSPLDIGAFVAASIPLLFGLLFPLINVAIKKDIVGHLHPVVTPPSPVPLPSGPGIPVSPV